MSTENLELASCGLKCNNPKCDWKVENIPVEIWQEWVNAKCPKCGNNVLTFDDYVNVMVSIFLHGIIREFSWDEFENRSQIKIIKELLEWHLYTKDAKVSNIELAKLLTNF